MTREYFQVPVAEVVRETDEACSLVLDVPAVPEFSAAAVLGRQSALVEGCGSLRDSIDAAVAAGRLGVSPPLEVTPP